VGVKVIWEPPRARRNDAAAPTTSGSGKPNLKQRRGSSTTAAEKGPFSLRNRSIAFGQPALRMEP
jgi:hypothetical protein